MGAEARKEGEEEEGWKGKNIQNHCYSTPSHA